MWDCREWVQVISIQDSLVLLLFDRSLKLKEYLKVESVGISVWDKNLKLEFSPFLFLPVRVYVLL